jgi:hypothetical protein
VAGGGPASGWRGRGSSAQQSTEKSGKRGAPLTVEEFATAKATGQQRWRARTATWSASDTGDDAVRMGAREVRRGDGAARTAERRCRSAPLWHGADAWQPRGDDALTGGPCAESGG